MNIVRTDSELKTPLLDRALQDAGYTLTLLPHDVSEEELVATVESADLILMCYTTISRTVIESAPRLRGIVKYGVGIDAIDIQAAKDNNVVVVNVPLYAEETVAEGAFGLMLALARKLPALDRAMNKDAWAWPEPKWLGSDIAGKCVGLVGVGTIGRSFARMAAAGFRARVVGFDPAVSKSQMEESDVEKYTDLKHMLSECDFVSIHCVLTPDTHHLIGEAELAAMKPTAFLINVSRGSIVDEQALVTALREGRIAGAGLDVYEHEPLNHDDHVLSSLFDMPNVILLPHLTFYTNEAMERLEEESLERCLELIERRPVTIKSKDSRLGDQSGVAYCL